MKTYQKKKTYNPAVKIARDVSKYYSMEKDVTEMFAAFVITLKEKFTKNGQTISDDEVMDILGYVQYEWQAAVAGNYNLADKCATEYGFDVRSAGK